MRTIVILTKNIFTTILLWVVTPLILFFISGQPLTVYLERDYPSGFLSFTGFAIFFYLSSLISLIRKEKLYRYLLAVLFLLEFSLLNIRNVVSNIQIFNPNILVALIPIAFSLLIHISSKIHLQKNPKALLFLRILYSCAFLLPFIIIITNVIGPHQKVEHPITVSLSKEKLSLAAPGPGFPQIGRDLPSNTKKLDFNTWVGVIGTKEAENACARLSQSGKNLGDQPLNYWRLPTAEEQIALLDDPSLEWPKFFTFYFTSSNQADITDITFCDKDRDGKCIYVVRVSDKTIIPEFTSMWRFGYRCVHTLD